jgi:hypothetical protein
VQGAIKDALWQHGPGVLWIAAGGLLAATTQLGSGGAYAVAILVRPTTAVIPALVGLTQARHRRSVRPALQMGLMAGLGIAAIALYSLRVFGVLSISGGYGAGVANSLASADLGWYLKNVTQALVNPERGVLVYAPFLIPLLLGLPAAWHAATTWVKGSALEGLAYFLLQYKANRFTGGGGYQSYRYPLEALAAAAPLLVLSYSEWVRRRWLARNILSVFVVAAVVTQAAFAIYS